MYCHVLYLILLPNSLIHLPGQTPKTIIKILRTHHVSSDGRSSLSNYEFKFKKNRKCLRLLHEQQFGEIRAKFGVPHCIVKMSGRRLIGGKHVSASNGCLTCLLTFKRCQTVFFLLISNSNLQTAFLQTTTWMVQRTDLTSSFERV